MTNYTSTEWKCDRCFRVETTGANEQPKNWSSLMQISPPLAVAENTRWHLCPECCNEFYGWRVRTSSDTEEA
jgi:hypothetical protein